MSVVAFLPGAGGGAPDLAVFRAGGSDMTRFEKIEYPGWQRYIADDFSPDALICELSTQIAAIVPEGPIRIIGMSIGGHFGYAIALHLQTMGLEIAGLCAIDSFMIQSAEPSAGWKARTIAEALDLLSRRRAGEFIQFARSKFWRAALRFAGDRLPNLLRRLRAFRPLHSCLALDSILQEELSMRLLLREVAPWIASLDRRPVELKVPTILLRTARTACDDAPWRRRWPNIEIYEVRGQHLTLFEPENVGSLRDSFLAATRKWR